MYVSIFIYYFYYIFIYIATFWEFMFIAKKVANYKYQNMGPKTPQNFLGFPSLPSCRARPPILHRCSAKPLLSIL